MSSLIYSYSPRPGELAGVERPEDGEAASVITAYCHGERLRVTVPAAAVPKVARGLLRAMHEAARLPVPIVLDRPDLPGDASFIRDFMVQATEDGEVRIGLDAARRAMPPDGARRLAAYIAGRADEAEAGHAARAAQVEALAGLILADEWADGGRPDRWAERAARAVLDRYELKERTDG